MATLSDQLAFLTRFSEKISIVPFVHSEFYAEPLPRASFSRGTISSNLPVLPCFPLPFYLLRRLWISWGWSSLLLPQWRMGLKVVGLEDLAGKRDPQVCLQSWNWETQCWWGLPWWAVNLCRAHVSLWMGRIWL